MTPTTEEKPAEQPQATPIATFDVQPRGRATVELIKVLSEHPEHAAYIKQLVEAETQRDLFDQDYRLARVFAASGKFDDIKGTTPEQAVAAAMAKIRIGREWGMNDSDSIAFIYFTNGKPAVMTEILATKIHQAGYGWDIEWHWSEEQHKGKPWQRCTGCTLWLKQFDRTANKYVAVLDRKSQPVSASFTEADADHAEYYEKGGTKKLSEKWNFKSWGQDMYFWRAMGRLRKYYLTGVMRGAVQYELRDDYTIDPGPKELPPAAAEPEQPGAPEPENRKPLADRIIEADKEPE